MGHKQKTWGSLLRSTLIYQILKQELTMINLRGVSKLSVILISYVSISACAMGGEGKTVVGDAHGGNAVVNIGPIGPVIGIGDSAVKAAQAAAEAYLKTLQTPLSLLTKADITVAGDKAVAALAQTQGTKPTAEQEHQLRTNLEKAMRAKGARI